MTYGNDKPKDAHHRIRVHKQLQARKKDLLCEAQYKKSTVLTL
jgi:hypothetical protein